MKVTKTVSKEIGHCAHECPYFDLDGGPGPVMYCRHPEAPDSGYIIHHPECDEGFPSKCPLHQKTDHSNEVLIRSSPLCPKCALPQSDEMSGIMPCCECVIEPWWKDDANRIYELENESWGLRWLYGHETPDGWEYAIVSWHYKQASIICKFKNGKVTE